MTRAAFVIGASRSGTSVLAEALSRHSEIFATEELHFYNLLDSAADGERPPAAKTVSSLLVIQDQKQFFALKNGEPVDAPSPPAEAVPQSGQSVLPAFLSWLARREGARVVVEHTPMNLYYRDRIRADFGDPVFLLVRRDPRAILASQKKRWQVGSKGKREIPEADIVRWRWAGHPLIQVLLLRATLRAIEAAATESDVVSVVYEEMVQAPERVLPKVAKAVGVAYDPVMAQVSDRGSSHASEVGNTGFDTARLDSWQWSLSKTEIWLCERLFSRALQQGLSGARPRAGELVKLVLTFPLSVLMAGYYSLSSYGKPLDAVRRRFIANGV